MDNFTSTTAQVSKDRGQKYGNYRELVFMQAEVKAALNKGMGYVKAGPLERETINAIVAKLCRLANGEVTDLDGWVDIAGYANLVVRESGMGQEKVMVAASQMPQYPSNLTGGAPRGR